VAVEDAMTRLMITLEEIKDVYGVDDDKIAAAVATAPGVNEFWREWRRRQAPLTEQIPIVEQSVGDVNDL
jgi:hypothetical protein